MMSEEKKRTGDAVSHPPYYCKGGIECHAALAAAVSNLRGEEMRRWKTMADRVSGERVVSDDSIRLILRLKTTTVQGLVRQVSHIRTKMEQARTVEDIEDIENDLVDLEESYRTKAYQTERLLHRMAAVRVNLLPRPQPEEGE